MDITVKVEDLKKMVEALIADEVEYVEVMILKAQSIDGYLVL